MPRIFNPAGAISDIDRSAPREAWFSWDSQAEVATHIADDHWTIEIRIPVTQDENDPLHQVIGRKPDVSLPWHFNVCRQRIRGNAQEYSAFSPTGLGHFHELTKFAHFYDGNSHRFEAAEPDDDVLHSLEVGAIFSRQGKHSEALDAYTSAAKKDKLTDFQKSVAFEHAAASARRLRKHDIAGNLAAQIPIDAVKKTVLMQNLQDEIKAVQVIEQFSTEDIGAWPFWKVSDGYVARGRAYAIAKSGKEAESDLLRALESTSDRRLRDSIRYALGSNREANLKDDTAAMTAYLEIIDGAKQLDTTDHLNAIQGAAGILTRRGKYDEALTILHKVQLAKQGGYWRGSILLTIGETQRAGGRKDEATTTFKSLIADETVDARLRKVAEEAVAKLRQ